MKNFVCLDRLKCLLRKYTLYTSLLNSLINHHARNDTVAVCSYHFVVMNYKMFTLNNEYGLFSLSSQTSDRTVKCKTFIALKPLGKTIMKFSVNIGNM